MNTPWKSGTLFREAARYRGRSIGLYGGSFNPSHKGHIHIAQEAKKRLGLDEVWFLVSPGNPLKPTQGMASLEERMESVADRVGGSAGFRVRDIESGLETNISIHTVSALKSELPHTKFIWLMGADNLATFHHWRDWQKIAGILPIAVFDRPEYALKGLKSQFARQFARKQVPYRRLKQSKTPAWTFMTIPRHPGSATQIRNQVGDNWYANWKRKDT